MFTIFRANCVDYFHSAVSKDKETAPRTGFLHFFKQKDVSICKVLRTVHTYIPRTIARFTNYNGFSKLATVKCLSSSAVEWHFVRPQQISFLFLIQLLYLEIYVGGCKSNTHKTKNTGISGEKSSRDACAR